ncbi:hypothetical protein HPB50_000567 [Hyalomma asiaticum]|uniref:Uncharacterized protein n=1 Tax=Hyalomma asiaticum TaxID=266040 RepID=A0ACB7T017_HYAAI|nr:hypothetical protein HPB50_000567 [Hyalomma asiaticum]
MLHTAPSRSTDTSSLSSLDTRERKQRPRSYFYKGLKLPSGRLVDIRYRNKYIRKWARKEAVGDPCQICCAVFTILLLLTILYAYMSNQVTPKTSSKMPLDQRVPKGTIPFTRSTEDYDEVFAVEVDVARVDSDMWTRVLWSEDPDSRQRKDIDSHSARQSTCLKSHDWFRTQKCKEGGDFRRR